ncbi:MAG TPA: hypothetical protein VIC26_03870 [Marinagarivorans sp.]
MVRLFSIGLMMCGLAACGSGGSSDKGNAANSTPSGGNNSSTSTAIPRTEIEETVLAAAETTASTIVSDISPGITPQLMASIEKVEYLATLPVGPVEVDEETDVGSCGGTMYSRTTTSSPDDNTIYPISTIAEITYDEYCDNDGYTVDGIVYYEFTYNSQSSIYYAYRWDITYYGLISTDGVYHYKFSNECTITNSATECTDGAWYESSTGSDYTLSSSSVSGNNSSGYDVSGTFIIDGDNGYQLTATGLTLCDNGNFGAGSIALEYQGAEYLTINFTSCTDFTYVYDGVAYTGSY